jgi:hypothetical protein
VSHADDLAAELGDEHRPARLAQGLAMRALEGGGIRAGSSPQCHAGRHRLHVQLCEPRRISGLGAADLYAFSVDVAGPSGSAA